MNKVKVRGTNTVFDGMTGIVESENDDKVTVMLDFDDKHKVRNTFKRDNLEEVVDEDLEVSTIDVTDDAILALAQELDVDPGYIERYDEDADSRYYSHLYVILDDEPDHGGEEWLVFDDYSDAEAEAKESMESLVDDVGPIEAFGEGTVSYYLDEDWFYDMMREDVEYWVDDMSTDDLIDNMERLHLINEDEDKVQDPDWEPDEDTPADEQEPDMIYPEDLIESKKDELIDEICAHDYDGDGVEWYKSMFGERDLSDYVKEHPDCINMDALIENNLDVANELNRYDGREEYIRLETNDGTKEFWAYRQD